MAYADTHQTARDPFRKDGEIIALEMSNVKIYKGDIVRILAAGYVASGTDLAIGDMCAGIALETVDNSGGSPGDKSIRVLTEGNVSLLKGTPAQTDAGTFALHATTNQQTITSATAEAAASVTVGAITGIAEDDMTGAASTTRCRVQLLTLRQAKSA